MYYKTMYTLKWVCEEIRSIRQQADCHCQAGTKVGRATMYYDES